MRTIRRSARRAGLLALVGSLLAGLAVTASSATGTTSNATAGGEPPQFIVVSFDGGGNIDAWKRFRDVMGDTGSNMTVFLSGVYLVPEQKAYLYDPPGHPRGTSAIGFAAAENVLPRMEQVRLAHAAGNEIGTHFNGHFCDGTGEGSWSTTQWLSDIRQMYSFLDNWRVNSGNTSAAPLGWNSSEIVGGRTPCLEGRRDQLFPAEAASGFRYDSSGEGSLRWPSHVSNGLWEIPMQDLRMAGSGREVLSMDYNFFEAQASGAQTLQTYRNAYRAVYNGNRAPLILGNHFSPFNGGTYLNALETFLRETCTKPNTRCVSFEQLVDWMDAQPTSTLRALQARGSQSMSY
jgi:hypothetical protein